MQKTIYNLFIMSLLALANSTFGQTLGADGKTFYILQNAFIGDAPPTQMTAVNTEAKSSTDIGLSAKVMSSSIVNFTWKAPIDNTHKMYVIQRSTDAKTYTNVGQIWANQLRNNQLNFTDNTIEEGVKTAQYRVVAYFSDAHIQLYTPVSVNLKQQE